MTKISVIIPVLNEAENISELISHVITNSSKKNIEIIVVDGGSTDGSQKIILEFVTSSDSDLSELDREGDLTSLDTFLKDKNTRPDIILLSSDRGRAKQMNLGVQHTNGDILYFLHADSFPPKNFDSLIISEIEKGNPAGCFKMKFDSDHWWLKLAGWLTKLEWRACRGGDQSQFITKQLFEELKGFNEKFMIYEDNDLINKLYAKKQFVVIQEWITTSARKYHANGIWRLQYHFWAIYVKKWFGASPDELHKYYLKYIN